MADMGAPISPSDEEIVKRSWDSQGDGYSPNPKGSTYLQGQMMTSTGTHHSECLHYEFGPCNCAYLIDRDRKRMAG